MEKRLLTLLLICAMPVLAAPKSVFTDPETGFEIWQMTNWAGYESPDYYTSPLFSPDGKYLAYHSHRYNPTYLALMRTDGTGEKMFGTSADISGGGPAFGWWSHDSRYWFKNGGLLRIDILSNTESQIGDSSMLPFYHPVVSPDGRRLFGVSNRDDSSSQKLKIVNVDGTGYVSITPPEIASMGVVDVTHGWIGNDRVWYWTSDNDYYPLLPVLDLTGQIRGYLDAAPLRDWTGAFAHVAVSYEAYFIAGSAGLLAGQGSGGILIANSLYESQNKNTRNVHNIVDAARYPAFGSPEGEHMHFSPDGQWLAIENIRSDCSKMALYPTDPAKAPKWLVAFGPSTRCIDQQASGYEPYMSWSPDSTKVVFGSSYDLPNRNQQKQASNDVDVYVAVVKKPEAPTNVAAQASGSIVSVTWKPSSQHREIKEYEIYKSGNGGAYAKIATVPSVNTYLDAPSKIGLSETTINVDSTSDFPSSGYIEIFGLSPERPSEVVRYSGKTQTSFTGCERGVMGTIAAEHYNDAFVWKYTGAHGYSGSYSTGDTFAVKAVEWSGLSSALSTVSGGCVPDWQCSAWSACSNNLQTRTCSDSNSCGTSNGKPAESQSCTSCPIRFNAGDRIQANVTVNVRSGPGVEYSLLGSRALGDFGTVLEGPAGVECFYKIDYDNGADGWSYGDYLTKACAHDADTDCDSCISQAELVSYISMWKAGTVSLADLMGAISTWKKGC